MKVISLHQPWANWVITGGKTIETRLHKRFKSLVGQRIAIHATKHLDISAVDQAIDYMYFEPGDRENTVHRVKQIIKRLPLGCIVGTVFVSDFRELTSADSHNAMIDCGSIKRFGLILTEPKQLKQPIPINGHQGIWEIDNNIIKDF